MKLSDAALQHRRAIGVTTAIVWLFGLYFVRGYLMLIAIALILAFLFNPTYQRFLKRTKKEGRAVTLTLLTAMLIVIIPALIIIALSVHQARALMPAVSNVFGKYNNVNDFSSQALGKINSTIHHLGFSVKISSATFHNFTNHTVHSIATSLVHTATSFVQGFIGFFTTAIIFIAVFTSFLTYQKSLLAGLKSLSPLGPEITTEYLNRMGLMTKGMVQGQFVVAFAQGVVDAILIYIGGLHTAFFFMALLLTALSIIPLGGGIVAIPIGLWLMATGNVAGGLVVILGHLLIVTNIDNVLRPRLVPKQVKIPSVLTLIAVFAGISMFGFMGIIFGPIIMIVIVSTTQAALILSKQPASTPHTKRTHLKTKPIG